MQAVFVIYDNSSPICQRSCGPTDKPLSNNYMHYCRAVYPERFREVCVLCHIDLWSTDDSCSSGSPSIASVRLLLSSTPSRLSFTNQNLAFASLVITEKTLVMNG